MTFLFADAKRNYPKLPFLLLPWFRLELPGWGRLYRFLRLNGIDNVNPYWRNGPKKKIRGKMHGYDMELDLSDDIDRFTYFLGRYYDLNIQQAIASILKLGDTFIDIGANIGNTTLTAAKAVGPSGLVLAFEPHPACFARLCNTLRSNSLAHVTAYPFGLGENVETRTLKVLGGGTILGTFTEHVASNTVREMYEVTIEVGDDKLNEVTGRTLIKIDIEGFELFALLGLRKTIARLQPIFITEVSEKNLNRSNVTVNDLYSFFRERGYRPYTLGLRRANFWRYELRLSQVHAPGGLPAEYDALWLPHDSTFDPSPYLA